MEDLFRFIGLFVAAVVAGAVNSVAGGGSLISFPALVAAGVPSIPANATNTAAMWPGSLSSEVAYRKDARMYRAPFVVAYRVRKDHIEILAVLHGARRWPERFE